MTKSQSGKAFNTAKNQQDQSSQNAQSSYSSATGDISNFKDSLADYAAKNPFVQGGEFQTSTDQQLADTAAAGAKSGEQAITGAMVRSGLNPAGAIAAGKQVAQENSRNQMDAEARATQARLEGLTKYNTTTLDASAKPEEMDAALMKDQLSAEQGALGAETDASKTPSFWQELGQGAINAGASYAGGMCPAEGSLYLMADGTEKTVEELHPGEWLLGIDGEPEMIEQIEKAPAQVLRIETAGGLVLRCSRVHAFALPHGGFTTATKVLGKHIVIGTTGEFVPDANVVKSVEPDGWATVFNVITDGSHTYRANGMWSLGVGEAERHVSMDEWNRIAEEVL